MKKVIGFAAAAVACLLMGCQTNIKYGTASLENGAYAKAIGYYEEDIAKGKNLKEAYRGVGIAEYQLGEYEAALTAFEAALQHEAKETAALYHMMAECHYELQAYEEALEFYGKALAMEDCTEKLSQGIRFNEIAICLELSEWEMAKEKVAAYVQDYPDDTRMDKTAEFLETR